MNKHDVAIFHAKKALILIQDELLAKTESGTPNNEERFTVMVIALHNIAVEHEYLKQVRPDFSNLTTAFLSNSTLQEGERLCHAVSRGRSPYDQEDGASVLPSI
jgi:hypothetical protein